MDGSRFDGLTRTFAAARSRRAMIRGMAGAILATLGLSQHTDAAKCRADTEICRKDGDCCSGACDAPDNYGRRRCGCSVGTHACNGACVSNSDVKTCGTLCTPCPTAVCNSATCIDGVCGLNPLTGPNLCGPSNVSTCRAGVCSCFVAGTRVAMADGSSKPIEYVSFGDLVLGENGTVNTVIGVETPVLGDRKLYSLNGGDPFVTAEHPFLTTAGWKSIDPSATADENPGLRVDTLTIGDSLVQLVDALVPALVVGRDAVELRTESIPLRTLRSVSANSETALYNLLLDGDHTYFANELLVHNKD